MEIRSAKFLISNTKLELCPKPDKPEYAFIGRSNVGKSSLINMLTNQTKLAKTSASPGKTQLINHFLINDDWYIVDLPGYGYAKVSQTQRAAWEKMIWNYLKQRENLLTIFVLIDSRIEPQKLDLEFMGRLAEEGIAFNMIFTKADKNTQRETAKNVRNFIEKMKEEWEFIPRSFITSTVKFTGRKQILSYIDELNQEYWEEKKAGPQQ
ncbi:MAG: YihA family ribosome biogenesis GTP-binding protein [Sphingobacteriales bacterium]|nr:MAG: YihA family ribosome biogenesis GTP-binding protein [Sphingobacteriales bacterium]